MGQGTLAFTVRKRIKKHAIGCFSQARRAVEHVRISPVSSR
jgi:hypothetical protein